MDHGLPKKMEKTGEEPINATSGYGFYVRTNYNDWYVVDRLDRLYSLPQTDSFQRGEKYYLSVPIGAAEGYIFNTSRDFRFRKITVDGEDLDDFLKKPYLYADSKTTECISPSASRADTNRKWSTVRLRPASLPA